MTRHRDRPAAAAAVAAALLALVPLCRPAAAADAPAAPKDTQAETVRLTTPEQAAASFTGPEGFHVSLFASEPEVRQPIAVATDPRGRLWVAENNTYSERAVNFDPTQRDRILVFEDTDHDGRADRHTVFWDRAQKLTSVELGFGGVWALCPPRLLFLPDRDGDDVPDGEPEVVLDGWDDTTVRHNIANGLRWGPDGWLYGRHGIQATSYVGAPGTPRDQRTALNCSIWRYHPTRKQFEVVCRGGTNSWGHDWDAHGELFYINTVIGHLWHAVPGAYGRRMYGSHDNPHLYEYLEQTADHVHWDTAETWDKIRSVGVSPTTDQAGGGHAHTGLLIYQGDNWPDRYRGALLTLNYHGRRVNSDTLVRRGSGFVGHHAPDLLRSSDPWFRPIDLIPAADGGVFIADWSDLGECHDDDGVHRSSGRIYKVVYGTPAKPAVADVSALGDAALVALQGEANDWLARQARHALHQRAAADPGTSAASHEALRAAFASGPHPLRALWGLYVTGGAPEDWLLKQLGHGDEHVRSWAVRLLVDGKAPTAEAARALTAMAPAEPSGLVLLYLASALQKFPAADRWGLAGGLAARSEYADDPALPLMIWYGVEAAVPDDPARAVALAGSTRMPRLTRLVARRLTENLERVPAPVDALVASLGKPGAADHDRAVLTGMVEALRGWRKAPAPGSWPAARDALTAEGRDGETRRLARELSVVFGDGRALDDVLKLASAGSADPPARRDAIRVLVDARDRKVVPLLRGLLRDRDLGADAARGLAAFDDPEIPRALVESFASLRPAARAEAIVTLCARPASALALLKAVASGAVGRGEIPAFQVRQLLAFPDEEVRRRAAELWPGARTLPAAKREQVARLRARLTPDALADADLPNGRRLFVTSCATCHTLFGQGGKIGPDLTGSQRQSLDYLLENVVDPSATVTSDYRMSSVALTDGRVLNGIVGRSAGPTLTVQTPTEQIVVRRADVDAVKDSDLSLMPEGLLDPLTEAGVRDLFAYLMSPQQVPLPDDPPAKAGTGK